MENKLIRKSLSLLIIIFFIAISFSPCITADIKQCVNNTELFKYKSSIYGLYGKDEYDVYLTQEEKTQLDNLLVEIDIRLHNSKSIENSIFIYKWAIERFNDLNLLKDYSVKEVYNLAVGNVKNRQLVKEVKNYFNRDSSSNNITENENCLVKGNITSVQFWNGSPPWFKNIQKFVDNVFGEGSLLEDLLDIWYLLLNFYYTLFYGQQWDAQIVMGYAGYWRDEYGFRHYSETPCKVDLWSDGDYGIVEWQGKMWGQIKLIHFDDPDGDDSWYWTGINHFTGLSIWKYLVEGDDKQFETFYVLGNAGRVALSHEQYPE